MMNKYHYDIVNADGEMIMEIISSFTNLTKDEYFNDYLAGEVLTTMSHAFGERVFVASWREEEAA
jgi:hypothetical protein